MTRRSMLEELVILSGFVVSPFVGLASVRLLFRTGWVTDGTVERRVWFSSEPQEMYAFKSTFHKVVAWGLGFFAVWILTLLAYVFLLDAIYPGPPLPPRG